MAKIVGSCLSALNQPPGRRKGKGDWERFRGMGTSGEGGRQIEGKGPTSFFKKLVAGGSEKTAMGSGDMDSRRKEGEKGEL